MNKAEKKLKKAMNSTVVNTAFNYGVVATIAIVIGIFLHANNPDNYFVLLGA